MPKKRAMGSGEGKEAGEALKTPPATGNAANTAIQEGISSRPRCILGLDLGLTTGWAFQEAPGSRVEHGIFKVPDLKGESAGMRFVRFRQWLETFTTSLVRPDLIVYEMPHLRGMAATEVLVGFSTRVKEIGAEAGIEYTSVHSATLKAWATKSGRSGKGMMVQAAKEMFPDEKIRDDNEADAMLILAWARKNYGETSSHGG